MKAYKRIISISEIEFQKRINSIHSAKSLRDGIEYTNIVIKGNEIYGVRKSTNKPFRIDLNSLYQAHNELEQVNTKLLKIYVQTRAQSPALAILKEIGVI